MFRNIDAFIEILWRDWFSLTSFADRLDAFDFIRNQCDVGRFDLPEKHTLASTRENEYISVSFPVFFFILLPFPQRAITYMTKPWIQINSNSLVKRRIYTVNWHQHQITIVVNIINDLTTTCPSLHFTQFPKNKVEGKQRKISRLSSLSSFRQWQLPSHILNAVTFQ